MKTITLPRCYLCALLLVLLILPFTSSYAFEHNVGDGAHGLSESPSPVVYKDQLMVFYQGHQHNEKIEFRVLKPDGEWSLQSQIPVPHRLSWAPSAVTYKDKVYIFYKGVDDATSLWYITYDGHSFSHERMVSGLGMTCSPGAVVFNDKLYVFHNGSGNSSQLWYSVFDGNKWENDKRVPNVGMYDSPAPVVYQNKIYVFHRSSNGKNQLFFTCFDGKTWAKDTKMGNAALVSAPSASVYEGEIYVTFQQWNGNKGMDILKFNGSTYRDFHAYPGIAMDYSPGSVVYRDAYYAFYNHTGNVGGYLWYWKKENGVGSFPAPPVDFSFVKEGLLDKKFGSFTIPATHNTYIAPPEFIFTNNSHDEGAAYQLAQGVRFIELDINYSRFPFNQAVEHGIGIIHGSVYGSSTFGQRNVQYALEELTSFLDKYKEEVVILKVDSPSGVVNSDLHYFFDKYGITNRVYTDRSRPITELTPRDILKAGKQILMIGHNIEDMACGLDGLLNYSIDWGGEVIMSQPQAKDRDKVAKPFYTPVMYATKAPLGFGNPDLDRVMNEYNFVKDQYLLKGWRLSAMRPFSLIYDFSTYGDIMEVIHELNHFYNSVKAVAKDENGDLVDNVNYQVHYSSDNQSVSAVMDSEADFPARHGEVVTITPYKEGMAFSPSSYTYSNSTFEDGKIEFRATTKATAADLKTIALENIDEGMDIVAPNPFDDHVMFKLFLPEASSIQLQIFDLNGKCVKAESIDTREKGMQEFRINTEGLDDGSYIYRCTAGQKILSGKLIKH